MSRTALRVVWFSGGLLFLLQLGAVASMATESSTAPQTWNACEERAGGDLPSSPSGPTQAPPVQKEANELTSCQGSVQGEEELTKKQGTLLTCDVVDASEEQTVDSAFLPGMQLPKEAERSLAELLSQDTVQWIEDEKAEGRGAKGGVYNGRYISADMKEVIRNFVESSSSSENRATAAPTIDQSHSFYDHGTDVGGPCVDLSSTSQKRLAPHDLACRGPQASASRGRFVLLQKDDLRQFVVGILKKEVILLFVVLTMIVLSLSALLFVYGVSDVCSGILSSCGALMTALRRLWMTGTVWQRRRRRQHGGGGEHLGDGTSTGSTATTTERSVSNKQTAITKHNARSKAKDVSGGGGKTTSKRKGKTHGVTKPKQHDALVVAESANSNSNHAHSHSNSNKKEHKKNKKATARNSCDAKDRREESDENNDWQEVMHNKPRGKSARTKQSLEEEEKSLPQIKVVHPKPPSDNNNSETTSPMSSNTTQQTPAIAQESEQDGEERQAMLMHREDHSPSSQREHHRSAAAEEPNPGLQVTLANGITAGVFSESKDSFSSAFDATPLFRGGDAQFLSLPPQQQSPPVQRSPFAASADLPPFSCNSPVAMTPTAMNMFPAARPQTAEEQFQSKIDCLLRNLRNKPFSVHPVTRSQHQPLRRAVTDLEEQMAACRMNPFNLQYTFSGSLDASCTSSGTLNNRACAYQPSLVDDAFLSRRPNNSGGGGLQTSSCHPRLMRHQRAGSLPLTQQQSSQPFFLGHNQGSAKTPTLNINQLSNDCSLFSSNPSIWSVDLAVDRNLVKSSMSSSNTGFSSPVSAPPSAAAAQNIDFKRCLPDQLLSEVGSFPNS